MEHIIKIVGSADEADVIVHSGVFHADDCMAVAIAAMAHNDLNIFRGVPTEEQLLDSGIMCIDIGNHGFGVP